MYVLYFFVAQSLGTLVATRPKLVESKRGQFTYD